MPSNACLRPSFQRRTVSGLSKNAQRVGLEKESGMDRPFFFSDAQTYNKSYTPCLGK